MLLLCLAACARLSLAPADPARGGPPLHDGLSPLPPFSGVSRATAVYVGVPTCAGCHPEEAAIWARSKHAHSRDTLAQAQSGSDPGCLRCHVTGLGHPRGWDAERSSGLAAVGCEACHGPGSDHVAAPAKGYGGLPRDAAACTACHSRENSPDFSWADYWPAVAHGGS